MYCLTMTPKAVGQLPVNCNLKSCELEYLSLLYNDRKPADLKVRLGMELRNCRLLSYSHAVPLDAPPCVGIRVAMSFLHREGLAESGF